MTSNDLSIKHTDTSVDTRDEEVVEINDHQEETLEPLVPHERQIMDDIIALWKEDPSTESLGVAKLYGLMKKRHPNWSVSEKRTRTLLKKFGLMPNAANEQFTYAKFITSTVTPTVKLPDDIHIIMTSKRGKGLYAKRKILKGDLIWSETPLFFVPPIANVNLIKAGKACSYCSRLLSLSDGSKSILRALDCNVCNEIWCSQTCKKLDSLHSLLKHSIYVPNGDKSSKLIKASAFLDLQDYCLKEQWNALYAITIIYANIVTDKTGTKRKQFNSMARVSQEVRYKALNSSAGVFDNLQGGALFVQEQQESLWREGYHRFRNVFPKCLDNNEINYEEFMNLLGTYNINNLDSSIYLIQSHLNHNCDPNTKVQTSTLKRTDPLKVYAARDIRAGEELTTTYVNPAHTVQQRQRELRVNWGFICGCDRCKNDLRSQQRRKSSSSTKDRSSIREMLSHTKEGLEEGGIDLSPPVDFNGERRKSVRFDEKVTKVTT